MEKEFKILWVEDEEALREIMCELLSGEGYHCVQASNGIEAREKLKSEEYNLLITDFKMPQMRGENLLFWCRSNDIHIPVIFVTGYQDRIPCEELALRDCCTSILNKPFSIDQIIEQIQAARKRQHEFSCRGYLLDPKLTDFRTTFPNQHRFIRQPD